ncbi:MAG TPA: serine/threonine-protein kinase, partial [Desulfuromonadaceae bacterium]|nr:serine/threonine-protein kinase [Desulfuromonadaceae bacterium]
MDTRPICPSCGKPLAPNAPKGLCPECLMKGAFPTGTAPDEATRFTPPGLAELTAVFPQLEILEFIGQGGMGAVYKVRQRQLDRIVALKILPPQAAMGPAFAERFTREARALAKLNHPHIVTLYEFGQADGLFYFLMEFVDGLTLRQLLNTSRIAPEEALAIVPQICEALQFAHDEGIVHRDIKPENILLDKRGRVKIADFGIAKIVADGLHDTAAGKIEAVQPSELTEAGSVLGTPQYMAPEQVDHPLDVDHRADIYSLGVVFYQMLTGELPAGKIEAPSRKVVIDVRLDEIVLRALEKKPELRFQKAADVKTLVETIAETRSRGADYPGLRADLNAVSGGKAGRTWLRNVTTAVMVASLAVAAICTIFYLYSLRGPNAGLADSPQELRKAPVEQVIQAALAHPTNPWPWQELQERNRRKKMTAQQTAEIVNGLAAWMRQKYPDGYDQPLFWMGDLLKQLDQQHLVDDSSALGFLDALYGSPSWDPLPRVRENDDSFHFTCHVNYHWGPVLSYELVNDVRAVRIDGRPVSIRNYGNGHPGQQTEYYGDLQLPPLSAGVHTVECEFVSGLIPLADMAGVKYNAPAIDWPPTRRTWTRIARNQFTVYPKNAGLIALAKDPALNPVANGAADVRRIFIRRQNQKLTAVLVFNLDPKKGAPVSVKVVLQLPNTNYPCGSLTAVSDGQHSSYSENQLITEIKSLDPGVKEATVILVPDPKKVESEPSITRLWGEDIVLRDIPLIRQDLETISGNVNEPDNTEEAAKQPAIFRCYPSITNQIMNEFLSQFDQTHDAFVAAVSKKYNKQTIDADTAGTVDFESMVSNFNNEHKNFPITTRMAHTWAQGDTGDARLIEFTVLARFHEALRRPIVPDEFPADVPMGETVEIVYMKDQNEPLTLAEAQSRGKLGGPTSFRKLASARSILKRAFPDDEQAT